MADIVAEVEQEALAAAALPVERRYVTIDCRTFAISDGELTPEQTRDLAALSRLVIFDSCGCGTYCSAFDILEGKEVDALVEAGVPTFFSGFAEAVEDEDGQAGVMISAPVRWGWLR